MKKTLLFLTGLFLSFFASAQCDIELSYFFRTSDSVIVTLNIKNQDPNPEVFWILNGKVIDWRTQPHYAKLMTRLKPGYNQVDVKYISDGESDTCRLSKTIVSNSGSGCEIDFNPVRRGDTVTITASQENPGGAHAPIWFHNGQEVGRDSMTNTFVLQPGQNFIKFGFYPTIPLLTDTCWYYWSYDQYGPVSCDVDYTYTKVGDTAKVQLVKLDQSLMGETYWVLNGNWVGFTQKENILLNEGQNELVMKFDPINGDTCFISKTILNYNEPYCSLESFDYFINGNTVEFTTNESGDVGIYSWLFGDGTGGEGASTSHEYNEPGTYTVHLIRINTYPDSCSLTQEITISEPVIPTFQVKGLITSSQPYSTAGTIVSMYVNNAGKLDFYKQAFVTDTGYVLYNVEQGDYIFQITPAAGTPMVNLVEPTYYQNTTNWSMATAVNIDRNVNLTIDFVNTLSPQNPGSWNNGTEVIEGNVVEEDDNVRVLALAGFEHVLVTLYNENGEKLTSVFSDSEGNYKFTNLPEGTYTLKFTYPGIVEEKSIEVVLDGDAETQEIVSNVGLVRDEVTLGVKKSALKNFTIYPNPTSDVPKIQGVNGDVTMEVLDLNGKVIETLKGNSANNFSVNGLKSGLYLVRVIYNNEVAVKPLMVK